MTGLPRVLAVAVLAAFVHAAATPCPRSRAADPAPEEAAAAQAARRGDRAPAAAAEARDGGPRLVAACPCGCDDHAPAAPGLHGLDAALPPAPPVLNAGPAMRCLPHPGVSVVGVPFRPIDHVPRAA